MTFDQTATLLRLAALVVILVPAVYNDLAFRKIPAWLVRTGFLTALVLSLLPMDRALFINHAGAFLAGGLIMYLFFLFGWVGAGDVKLFAVIAFLMGAPFFIHALFFTCMAGGVLGLGFLAYFRFKGIPVRGQRIPYGTAIAAGALINAAAMYVF